MVRPARTAANAGEAKLDASADGLRYRRRVERDLGARGLSRDKVTAAMVRLLELLRTSGAAATPRRGATRRGAGTPALRPRSR